MNRTRWNASLDWISFGLLAALGGTGFLLRFGTPRGSGGSKVLGLSGHGWVDVHFWIAVAFVAAMLAHLLLHAEWIRAVIVGRRGTSRRGWRVAGAMVAAVLLLGGATFLALSRPL